MRFPLGVGDPRTSDYKCVPPTTFLSEFWASTHGPQARTEGTLPDELSPAPPPTIHFQPVFAIIIYLL